MNTVNLQKPSCHVILLIILIGWSLCEGQINPARSSSLARRMIASIKSSEELGPLKALTNEKAIELNNLGVSTGKIENLDFHMNSIVKDVEDQKNFREWLDTRNVEHGVKLEDNGQYAEIDFLEQFLAWKTKGGDLSREDVKKLLDEYPLIMAREIQFDLKIPHDSYLRATLMTPGEFIERYLPRDDQYRSRFWNNIHEFKHSKQYWAWDFFTIYQKFALKEVENQGKMFRYDFIDRYLPNIFGVRSEFNYHLWRTPGLSNAHNLLPAKIYMTQYLKWVREDHIWRPVDTEWFFRPKLGEQHLKKAFIEYLYKEASRSGLKRKDAYFQGDIYAQYSRFLQQRKNTNFAKKILHKFQEWIYKFKSFLSNLFR